MLCAQNIQVSIGNTQILHGIDLEIEPGTITTIIGPSGCGKSTLLRALSLLAPPDRGTVTIDEQVFDFPRSEPIPSSVIWPHLTVVFQQLFLWPHLSLRQNATLPLHIKKEKHADENVDQIFNDFGIGHLADRYPNQVSIGQRQLAAIARAFALKPRYLLLDEVTSALDVEYVAIILNCIKKLKQEGVTLLLVSHLLDFAKKSADNIVFMDEGKIVEQGQPSILDSPSTQRLEKFLGLVREAR